MRKVNKILISSLISFSFLAQIGFGSVAGLNGLGAKEVEATQALVEYGDDQMPSAQIEGAFWYNAVAASTHEYWKTSRIVKDRVLPNRSFFIPSYTKENAIAHRLTWRESDNWQSLNGKWDFKLVARPSEVVTNFHEESFDPAAHNWIKMKVPASWPLEENGIGDEPMYSNHFYPWGQHARYPKQAPANIEPIDYPNLPTAAHAPSAYNPVGHYLTNFDVPADKLDQRVILNFQGVESAFYVYVNGKYVGYSEDTFTQHEFDITDKIHQDGRNNRLAVLVYRFSDGSFFENQDFIYLAGIFRDVGIIYKNKTASLQDFSNDIVQNSANNFTINTKYKVSVGAKVKAYLYDHDQLVAQAESQPATPYVTDEHDMLADQKLVVKPGSAAEKDMKRIETLINQGSAETTMTVANAKTWSVDKPNLYVLLLEIQDSAGTAKEYVAIDIGMREVLKLELDGNKAGHHTYALNGKPIVFKGTNRHELDAEYGRAVRLETIKKDLELMKTHNINAIRNSHYPNTIDLYLYANYYGIMILDEANLESHHGGTFIPKAVENFRYPAIHRAYDMYERSKNMTSVVAWSNGNEAEYTENGHPHPPVDDTYAFRLMNRFIKSADSKRPIVLERDNRNGIVDIRSNMYVSYGYDDSLLRNKDPRPYLQVEYSHAMGNSLGYYKQYWDTWRKHANSMGGFIWDFVDQSPLWPIQQKKNYKLKVKTENNPELTFNLANGEKIENNALIGGTTLPSENIDVANFKGADQTFSLFVKATPNALAAHNSLLNHGDKQWLLKLIPEGKLEFAVFNGSTWKAVLSSEETKLTTEALNKEHTFAVSYNAGAVKFYIDGKDAGTGDVGNNIAAQSQSLGIGQDRGNGGRNFQGSISKAAVYNKVVDFTSVADDNINSSTEGTVFYADFASDKYEENVLPITGITFGANGDKYYAYGGDWAMDKKNNDNNFLDNGLVSPFREPHGQMQQVKFVQADVQITDFNKKANTVKISNEFYDTDLSELNITYDITADGVKVVDETPLNISLAPRQTTVFTLPDFASVHQLTINNKKQYLLNFHVRLKNADTNGVWAKASYELSSAQFKLNEVNRNAVVVEMDKLPKNLIVEQGDLTAQNNVIKVKNDKFSFALKKEYNAASGKYDLKVVEYVVDGKTYFDENHTWKANFYRAPVDNDRQNGFINRVQAWRKAESKRNNLDLSVQSYGDGNAVNKISISATSTLENRSDLVEVFTIYSDGHINYAQNLQAHVANEIPSVGTLIELPNSFNTLKYFGRGPMDSYEDRWEGYPQAIFTEKLSDLRMSTYVKPQEVGNHSGILWATLTDANGNGLLVKSARRNLQVMLSGYDQYDVTASMHPYELHKTNKSYLRVADRVSGLGGQDSWGARPENYAVASGNGNYSFEYDLFPITASHDESKLYKTYYGSMNPVVQVLVDGKVYTSFNPETYEYNGVEGSDLSLKLLSNDYSVDYDINQNTAAVTAKVKNKAGEVVATYTFHMLANKKLTINSATAPSETTHESNPPEMAFDGNPSTIWHTPWSGVSFPLDYTIHLVNPAQINGMTYLPRSGGGVNGRLRNVEFLYRDLNTNQLVSIKEHTFENNDQKQRVDFDKSFEAKEFVIRVKTAESQESGKNFASAAEFELLSPNQIHASIVYADDIEYLNSLDDLQDKGHDNSGTTADKGNIATEPKPKVKLQAAIPAETDKMINVYLPESVTADSADQYSLEATSVSEEEKNTFISDLNTAKLLGEENKLSVYDIILKKNGEVTHEAFPDNEKMKVVIDTQEEAGTKAKVYLYNENVENSDKYSLIASDLTVDRNQKVSFEVEHFSKYLLVFDKKTAVDADTLKPVVNEKYDSKLETYNLSADAKKLLEYNNKKAPVKDNVPATATASAEAQSGLLFVIFFLAAFIAGFGTCYLRKKEL